MSVAVKTLFLNNWQQLSENEAWQIIYHQNQFKQTKSGYSLRAVLNTAKKPGSKLDKLPAEVLRDIYYDEGLFFNKPFHHFFTKAYKAEKLIMVAPMAELEDLSFMHFYYADASFTEVAIQQHNKEDYSQQLNKLIGTLYLPHNGKKKVHFDEKLVEQYSQNIVLYPYQKELILMSYAHIRVKILSRCPLLFPKADDQAPATPPAPVFTGPLWQKLHFEIADEGAFKGFKTAATAPLYKVLDYLEHKKSQNPKAA